VNGAAAKPATPARRLSRPRRAAHRALRAAVTAAAPYAGAVAVSAAAGAVLRSPDLPLLVAGAVAGIAGTRFHEAYGWHRAGGRAAMRARRRYQGTATRREIRRHLSAAAARRRAAVTSPGLHPSQAPVVIARARGQVLAGTREDSYLVIAPPRTGKTGLLGCWAADAPGAMLATSTRTDLYQHTVIGRRRTGGDVDVLNPTGDGGITSTLRWSPLEGCTDPGVAIQRAGYLMAAAPKNAGGRDAWWDAKGAELLRLMLHAAALGDATMREATAWVRDPLSAEPASILTAAGAPGWAHKLATLTCDGPTDQLRGIVASAETALAWMDDPAMAAAACPAGDGFRAREFLAGAGSVYLIGADRPHSSLAPYFACFAAHLFETAKHLASVSPAGRLPVPVTFVLDEAAITCPVPLHTWTSEAGGHGITIMAAVQAPSQLLSRWGEHDGRTITANSTVKVIFGGHTGHTDLEALSAVCGMRDTWDHVKHPDGVKTRQPRQERAIPPERIRMLRPGEALVLHRSTRPVIARVTPVWDRPGYERATAAPAAPPRVPEPQLAIGAPREAIPLPGATAPPAVAAPATVPAVPEIEEEEWQHEPRSASASIHG